MNTQKVTHKPQSRAVNWWQSDSELDALHERREKKSRDTRDPSNNPLNYVHFNFVMFTDLNDTGNAFELIIFVKKLWMKPG